MLSRGRLTRRIVPAAVAAGLVMVIGGHAAAQALPTLVSSTFDPATNTIGVPDVGSRTFSSYNGLFRSPNGRRWTFVGNLSGDTATNRVIVAGSLDHTPFSQGSVVIRKGGAIPGSTRTLNILDNPKINDAGQFVFSTNSLGSGSPIVFFLTGSVEPAVTYSVAAAIGEPIPFLAGATYTGGFNSTLLDNTGRWGFASGINDSSVVTKAVFFDNAIVARSDDAGTAPTPIPGGTNANWSDFVLRRVFVDHTGSHFYWLGSLGTTDLAASDNVGLAEEGQPLPGGLGGGAIAQSFFSGWLDPGGAWYLRATFADVGNNDFVLRNGTIVAQGNQPITPASTDLWSRVSATSTVNGFQFTVGNGRGDYVIGGSTVDPSGSVRSIAVVLNGQSVVARGGDPIDGNGNGLDDDNMYLKALKSETGPGTAFLTDDGWLWMVVSVGDDAGTTLGDAIIRKRVFTPCAADFNRDGSVSVQDIFDFLAAYFSQDPRADFNGAGGVTVQDIFEYLGAYFLGCA